MLRGDRNFCLCCCPIGPAIRQYDDSKFARGGCERGELVPTAGVVCGETPKIHQHDVAPAHERLQCVLPGRVVAIALVDAMPAIDVGLHVERGNAPCDVRGTRDKSSGQLSIEKLEDVMGVERAFGKSNVTIAPPETGAEDFSFFSNLVPGFYFKLGVVPEGKTSGGHHTPTFLADDRAVPIGMRALSLLALDYLSGRSRP